MSVSILVFVNCTFPQFIDLRVAILIDCLLEYVTAQIESQQTCIKLFKNIMPSWFHYKLRYGYFAENPM